MLFSMAVIIVPVTGRHTRRAIVPAAGHHSYRDIVSAAGRHSYRATVLEARHHSYRARVPAAGRCRQNKLFEVAIGTGTATPRR